MLSIEITIWQLLSVGHICHFELDHGSRWAPVVCQTAIIFPPLKQRDRTRWCAASLLKRILPAAREASVFNYSPHIHLAVPIIQGSTSAWALLTSPSCEKWVMKFKGTSSPISVHDFDGTTMWPHRAPLRCEACLFAKRYFGKKSDADHQNFVQWSVTIHVYI